MGARAEDWKRTPEIRSKLKFCGILNRYVLEVQVQEPDGRWRHAGCEDQSFACHGRCAFTFASGTWPFVGPAPSNTEQADAEESAAAIDQPLRAHEPRCR